MLFFVEIKLLTNVFIFSSKATLINEFAERIPTKDENERSVVTLDLQKLREANPRWTHVLLRTVKTNKKVYTQ